MVVGLKEEEEGGESRSYLDLKNHNKNETYKTKKD